MTKQKTINRKSFIRGLAWTGAGVMGWVWYRLSDASHTVSDQPEYRHSTVAPGVSFHGKYYLFCSGNEVSAFSTTCSHAGCRLGTTSSGIIHCGCHGSQFSAETGQPLKGPAIKPLQKLSCRYDASSGQWIVKTREEDGQPVKP
jgi:Rieske Fe-S protein